MHCFPLFFSPSICFPLVLAFSHQFVVPCFFILYQCNALQWQLLLCFIFSLFPAVLLLWNFAKIRVGKSGHTLSPMFCIIPFKVIPKHCKQWDGRAMQSSSNCRLQRIIKMNCSWPSPFHRNQNIHPFGIFVSSSVSLLCPSSLRPLSCRTCAGRSPIR